MRHRLFAPAQDSYEVAVLCKGSAFYLKEVQDSYINPLIEAGVPAEQLVAFTLEYGPKKKPAVADIKEYLAKLLPVLADLKVKLLLVNDGETFKVLTKQSKAEPHLGYALPCKVEGFEDMQVVLGLNYQQIIYNPEIQKKLDLALKTLAGVYHGTHQTLGAGIIHSAQYPSDTGSIAAALDSLHQHPELTCDIEAFSLKFWEAGIGTIAFAWDEHNGVAFACDYHRYAERPTDEFSHHHGYQQANPEVRRLLLKFFTEYKGTLTFHNAAYDAKVLIFVLWMLERLDNTPGLLDGLHRITERLDDTKLITYLATNSTAGNVLGLKPLAHEFAGNWAKDVTDIRTVPLDELLQYNLVDCLSTWFVKKKYTPVMIADCQEELYRTLFLPSQKLLLQMELTGLPMNKERIGVVRAELEKIRDHNLDIIRSSPVVQQMDLLVQTKAMVDANAKLKTKQHPLEHFSDLRFNPNSGPQKQRLLYEVMGLPVIDLTDSKQPATGGDTLEKLKNRTTDAGHKALIDALMHHDEAVKILGTFIKAFEGAIAKADDGIVWLFGSFNLGGTVSGRLSSSDPNLQNIPAGSTFGKLIKSIFMGPKGWLFCGADFNSLEDYISALTTKDPNKLRVYTEGYDGHCLRAFFYFRDQLPDIRQADPGERCFRIKTNGTTVYCKSGDLIILPDGSKVPVEDFYDSNRRV